MGRIIPAVHHFLSRLRDLQIRARNRRGIKLTDDCRKDLELMLTFLANARSGVDLNTSAFLFPTHVYVNDACPHGMGGWSHKRFAWRFYLPPELRFRASNNLLEHLAAVISVWVDILAGRLTPGQCCLSLTDSTTSEGWTASTNFTELTEEPIQAAVRMDVARSHALRLLDAGVKDYSQWFPGEENVVADALSRDLDRTDSDLTDVLNRFVPEQLPQGFTIVPLPRKISSWVTSLLARLPAKGQLQEEHTLSRIGRGAVGSSTPRPLVSTTSTSTGSPEGSGSPSWVPLPWHSAADDFRLRVMAPWLRERSEVPSAMYLRPSGITTGQTQQRMKTATLAAFYRGSTAPSRTATPKRSSRKRCRR